MFFGIVLGFCALVTASVMSFSANAAYWRACSLLLWAGVAAFAAQSTVGDLAFAMPLGVFFMIAGTIGVLAKVVVTAADMVDAASRPRAVRPPSPPRRPTGSGRT
jgi:hypothetical protein